MERSPKSTVVLFADDDPDDRELLSRALAKSGIADEFYAVADGEELLDFLHHRGRHAAPALSPTPSLILLDLNMPRMDGREALKEIKNDPTLRQIPVVVMTTSSTSRDIFRTYALGSNSFVCKPITLMELVELMKMLGKYWFQTVKLPELAGNE